MKQKELLKEFLRYVTLNVCGMIGLSCYILADRYKGILLDRTVSQ